MGWFSSVGKKIGAFLGLKPKKQRLKKSDQIQDKRRNVEGTAQQAAFKGLDKERRDKLARQGKGQIDFKSNQGQRTTLF